MLENSWQHTKTYVIRKNKNRLAFEILWKCYHEIGDGTVGR